MKLWGLFFLIFKDCLRIFVMFVNVDMCKTVLIAGESTDSAAIFIELLKFFCEVLLFLGCMCCLVTYQRHNLRGDGGVSSTLF